MANRRNKILDAPVNPAIMPGLGFLADTVTLAATKVLTVTFPAKTILAVLASPTADTDAEKVVWTSAVSGNTGTVTFTATSAGASNKFSYLIVYSVTETIEMAPSRADDTSYSPVG